MVHQQSKTIPKRNIMKNNTKKTRWGIVDYDLVDQGIPILETIVYSYIKRYQRNRGSVWASIPHIAKDLRMSESSVQRYIKHLLKVGLLKDSVKGRGRYLTVTHVKLTETPVKLTDDPCQSDMNDPCQIDMLPKLDHRSYIPISNNRSDINTKTKPKTGVVKGESVRGVTPPPARKPLSAQTRDWLAEMTGVSLDDLPD